MSGAGVSLIVRLAATPYAAIAGYDFWLHKSDRSVPKCERWLHGIILISVGLFIAFAAAGKTLMAALTLCILIPCAVADEVGYHGHLRLRERRIHIIGGLSLLALIGVWLWTV